MLIVLIIILTQKPIPTEPIPNNGNNPIEIEEIVNNRPKK